MQGACHLVSLFVSKATEPKMDTGLTGERWRDRKETHAVHKRLLGGEGRLTRATGSARKGPEFALHVQQGRAAACRRCR